MRNPDLEISLGARIKARRKELNLSQERLGLIAGIDRTAIAKIEAGERSIRIDTLAKLAKSLDVKMSELLEGLG